MFGNKSVNDQCQPQISTNDQFSLADRSSRWTILFRLQRLWNTGGNMAAVQVTLNLFIEGVTQPLKSQTNMCSTDRGKWYTAGTYHPENYCQMRNRQSMLLVELKHKKDVKKS
jgi:hypothetical protein